MSCQGRFSRFRVHIQILLHHRDSARQSRNQKEKADLTVNLLGAFRGHEKKFKKHQNCKFGLNEIKYLQLLIFAKRDFFSRPAPQRFYPGSESRVNAKPETRNCCLLTLDIQQARCQLGRFAGFYGTIRNDERTFGLVVECGLRRSGRV